MRPVSEKVVVSLIGVSKKESHFFEAIFKLSQSRGREYAIIDDKGYAFGNFFHADIIIVDKDNDKGMMEWKKMCSEAGDSFATTTVFLTKQKVSHTNDFVIQKPLVALRILNILDKLYVERKNSETDEAILASKNQQYAPSQGVTYDYKMLVIDDSLLVRKHLEHELSKYNCMVDCANSAEAGLLKLSSTDYSLIFLDVVLPGMDGHSLCKLLKKDKKRNTIVVMLTSKSSPIDRVKGCLSGCDSYLTKPVDADKLHLLINDYMQANNAIAV